jgi:hypothetical protein
LKNVDTPAPTPTATTCVYTHTPHYPFRPSRETDFLWDLEPKDSLEDEKGLLISKLWIFLTKAFSVLC